MIKKYTTVVEAVQFDGNAENLKAILDMIPNNVIISRNPIRIEFSSFGTHRTALQGYWIVKKGDGEIYTVADYSFSNRYKPLERDN